MEVILEIARNYPAITGLLSALYLLGLLNKAVFSALNAYVVSTAKTSDDELLKKVEGHRVYRAIAYALDLVARIKLPSKK